MIKQDLENLIEDAIEKTRKENNWECFDLEIKIEHPNQSEHGDYATNVALVITDKVDEKPTQIAEKIATNINDDRIEEIEAIKPGFINFFLKDSYFQKHVDEILEKGSQFGSSNLGENKKVVVEYGQPNTHKLPHVGHFRSYALGESLARLLEFNNYDVFRANYQGDVGLHVAKCLWGYKEKNFEEQDSLKKNVKNLQKAYEFGSQQYEENEETKKEIESLNNKIQRKNEEIMNLWKKTRQWSVDYYNEMHKKLGTDYDRLYFESEAGQRGKEIVMDNMGEVFEKSEGAIIFPGSNYGLHDRVFITSEGNPTYEAKDLALPFLKREDFDYDVSIISTASEQIEYFKVVYKALEQIDSELADKFIHVPFGLISLKGGKLSSRKGNIVSIDELLDQVNSSLMDLIKEKKGNPDQRTISKLTIGAIKYSLLKNTPIKNIVFDIEESIDLEGDSGPYLQYTNVRTLSILRKKEVPNNFDSKLLKQEEEIELLKSLSFFPEVIKKATQSYQPNLICHYLIELAQRFNTFYEEIPVLKAENEDLKKARLALVKATNQVLENALYLLGIDTPEKM